jgi:hypothetical protein
VLIAVTAADGRAFVLRFNCAGYPQRPPTGDYTFFGRSD